MAFPPVLLCLTLTQWLEVKLRGQASEQPALIEGAQPSQRARSITYSEFSRKGAASIESTASKRKSSQSPASCPRSTKHRPGAETRRPRSKDAVDKTASNKEQLNVGNLQKRSAARAKTSTGSKAPAPSDKPEQAEPQRYGGIKREHDPIAHAAASKRHTLADSPRMTVRAGDVLLWDCDRCQNASSR